MFFLYRFSSNLRKHVHLSSGLKQKANKWAKYFGLKAQINKFFASMASHYLKFSRFKGLQTLPSPAPAPERLRKIHTKILPIFFLRPPTSSFQPLPPPPFISFQAQSLRFSPPPPPPFPPFFSSPSFQPPSLPPFYFVSSPKSSFHPLLFRFSFRNFSQPKRSLNNIFSLFKGRKAT